MRIVSISSTPPYNEDAKARGVKRIVHKTYENIGEFSKKVSAHIRDMIG